MITSASVKIAGLFVLGLVIYLVPWWPLLAALFVLATLLLTGTVLRHRPPARVVRRPLTGLAVFAAAVFVVTAWTDAYLPAVINTLRMSAVWLAAFAVTLSTRFAELLDTFERWLQPLRRLGLRPDRMSLALALTIRFVPEIRARYLQIREAQYARGLQSNPLAVMIPLLVQTLNDAEDIAAAIDARCYDTAPER